MSETPRSEQPETESKPEEQKQEYNFEFMEEMEEAMVPAVTQLKGAIESGEYSALLGDDIKGRIPTLVLRKIFQEKEPHQNDPDKRIKACFVKSGKSHVPDVAGYDFGEKRILIVTEFIDSMSSLLKIAYELEKKEIRRFDFFVPFLNHLESMKRQVRKLNMRNRFYTLDDRNRITGPSPDAIKYFGTQIPEPEEMFRDLRRLSGVVEIEGQDHGVKKSSESMEEIVKAREDVDLMAKRVIEQVWGKE
jgi:hypothetical protein